MLASTSFDPGVTAWLGAAVVLIGEFLALLSLRHLPRLILISTIAECGYLLLGTGLGSPAGSTGALMHLGYQLVMRGLLVFAAWWLIRRSGTSTLAGLAGSGRRQPLAATLFAFGMFSVMGLSPFKGSYSKFLVLYAAIEQGQWLLAAAGTLASIIAAIYTVRVIQRVCLEVPGDEAQPPLRQAPTALAVPLAVLTALTVYMSIWPEPFLHHAAALAGVVDVAQVPQFESPWSTLVLVPYLGAFALYAIGRVSATARDAAALLVAAATLWLTLQEPALDAVSRFFALIFVAVAVLVVVY